MTLTNTDYDYTSVILHELQKKYKISSKDKAVIWNQFDKLFRLIKELDERE